MKPAATTKRTAAVVKKDISEDEASKPAPSRKNFKDESDSDVELLPEPKAKGKAKAAPPKRTG